jgi:hypothetical protein
MIHLNKHHYHYSTADLSAFETEHLFSLNVNRLIDKRIGMMIVWLKIARVAQKPWLSQGPNKHLYYLFCTRETLHNKKEFTIQTKIEIELSFLFLLPVSC